MSFAIRPRQDFSLSTFGRILETLSSIFVDFEVISTLNEKTDKVETLINFPKHSPDTLKKALKNVAHFTNTHVSDYRIVEVAA